MEVLLESEEQMGRNKAARESVNVPTARRHSRQRLWRTRRDGF